MAELGESYAQLGRRLDSLSDETGAAEDEQREIARSWSEVYRAYERASTDYERATVARAEELEQWRAAQANYEEAAKHWTVVRWLVVLHAVLTLQHGPRSRLSSPASCGDSMATSAFRHLLGITDPNLHVDHIIPRALDGADHPLNYRIVSSHENLSWGAHWGADKCSAVGVSACRAAIRISRLCGSF